MTKIIALAGTPIAKLQREYEEKLAEKDTEIEALKTVIAVEREKHAKASGAHDMLRLQLADLSAVLKAMQGQIELAQRNVAELRGKLAEGPDQAP